MSPVRTRVQPPLPQRLTEVRFLLKIEWPSYGLDPDPDAFTRVAVLPGLGHLGHGRSSAAGSEGSWVDMI